MRRWARFRTGDLSLSFQADARLRAQESTRTLEDADYAEVASDQARAQIRQSLLDKVAPLKRRR